ncbi:MAG TPA: hypothetical protein VIL46_00200, partial [Gemmataceae bacterium]
DEAGSVADARVHTVAAETPFRRVASFDSASFFPSLQFLPRLHKEYASDLPAPARRKRAK